MLECARSAIVISMGAGGTGSKFMQNAQLKRTTSAVQMNITTYNTS